MKLTKILSIALLACGMAFTSCSDNDEPEETLNSAEVYVLCNGNMSSQIPGSITSYDPTTGDVIGGAFAKANGRYIGTSVESAICVKKRLYIVSTQENIVEVVNANTLKSEATLKMIDIFGEKGSQPRYIAYYDDAIYVTTYAGYVCAIDIKNHKAKATYKVGSYPEGIAITSAGGMWVANSDYGMGENPSITYISLTTGETTYIVNDVIKNPYQIIADERTVWVLDRGSYDSSWNQTGAGLYKYEIQTKTWKKLADATMMSNSDGTGAVICNAPFHTPPVEPSYAYIDLTTEIVTPLPGVKVDNPQFLGLNKYSKKIYIGSNTTNPDTGYANYNSDGYVGIFDMDGKSLGKFTCGVCPMSIVFTRN